MTSDLERCKKYLRSILLATKGGVPEAQLVKRYREQTRRGRTFPSGGSAAPLSRPSSSLSRTCAA